MRADLKCRKTAVEEDTAFVLLNVQTLCAMYERLSDKLDRDGDIIQKSIRYLHLLHFLSV